MELEAHNNGAIMGLLEMEWHGPYLKAEREKRGFGDTAQALDQLNQFTSPEQPITKQHLANWERGKHVPSGTFVPAIMLAFGIKNWLVLYRPKAGAVN